MAYQVLIRVVGDSWTPYPMLGRPYAFNNLGDAVDRMRRIERELPGCTFAVGKDDKPIDPAAEWRRINPYKETGE